MANAIYPKYKESLLNGDSAAALNGSGATGLYIAMIDTDTYTYSPADQFYSDLSGIVGTDQEITTVVTTNGIVDGEDVTFTTVIGTTIEALVLYRRNAGANTTWPLVVYIDTGVTGLPLTPSGGNVIIAWNELGIFAL